MFGFSVRAKVGILEWIRSGVVVMVGRMGSAEQTTD